MHLFKTTQGIVLLHQKRSALLENDWDELVNRKNLFEHLLKISKNRESIEDSRFSELTNFNLLPPIGNQEVWAAGVTYLRSRDARMEESKQAGGADFYQMVYEAEDQNYSLKHYLTASQVMDMKFLSEMIHPGTFLSRSLHCSLIHLERSRDILSGMI